MLRAIAPFKGSVSKKLVSDTVTVEYTIDYTIEPTGEPIGEELPYCEITDVTYHGVSIIHIIPDEKYYEWEEEILEEELNY